MLDKGQQAPILVRADGARFVLVEGLHRLEAAKALGEKTVLCFLVDTPRHTKSKSPGDVEIRRKISEFAVFRSSASSRSRVSRAALVSWPPFEELPRATGALRRFGISALRLRALASLLLALERRLIAFPKAQDYADFQSGITAEICDRRNGYRSNCAAKFLNFACPVGVMCGHSLTDDLYRAQMSPEVRSSA